MNGDEDWLTVGKLVAAQGMQGELRINPSSDFPERFTLPGQRWLKERNGEPRPIELLTGRQLPGRSLYVVKFAGVNNRNAAEALVGQNLLVPASDRPSLAEGEFHLLDLVGLEARLEAEGPAIGHVTDLTTAGNDLLEIELLTGRRVLVPFVEAIVPEVQLNQGWLRLTPPPGLLEL
ncbi:MAG: Ribosome maturation factor RimM [Prochlorococcus marinus str. MIT 9313]|nr:MAG: Ribosome maturation factor RimM [Prochlorococcus marinus str. MIT 9313]